MDASMIESLAQAADAQPTSSPTASDTDHVSYRGEERWNAYLIGRARTPTAYSRLALYSPFDHTLATVAPVLPALESSEPSDSPPTLFVGEPTVHASGGFAALQTVCEFSRRPVIGLVHLASSAARDADAARAFDHPSDVVVVLAALIEQRVSMGAHLTLIGFANGAETIRRALYVVRAMMFGECFERALSPYRDVIEPQRAALDLVIAQMRSLTVVKLGAPHGNEWTLGPNYVHLVNRRDAHAARRFRWTKRADVARPMVYYFDDDGGADATERSLSTYLKALGALYEAHEVAGPEALSMHTTGRLN